MGAVEPTEPGGELSPAAQTTGIFAYLDFARRRGWVIVLVTALAIGAAYGVTRLLPETYETKASLFIGSTTATNRSQANDILYNGLVSENLARSYATFATSSDTLEDAEARLGEPMSEDDIEAAPVPSSQILEITASAPTAQLAADRANAVSDALVARISGKRTIPEAQLAIVNPAPSPDNRATPKLGLNLALGGLVGLLLGYFIAVTWERLESSPRVQRR